MVSTKSERYSTEEMMERAFQRLAWNIKHMWEETGHSDTRLFMEPIIPDQFVIVGQSSGGTHKEHIVPRVIICKQCHRMFEQGESVDVVAIFIRKYLKIVLISKEEQDLLDKKANLNLRQRMPDGWTFETGCEFERLKVAGIEYNLYSTKVSNN
ncbi:hypothetical protein [Methylovulum psychrotolerans]|uniref:Uncharacterized protein n=1 Tax=Methylovulum psychrotolerans TaxID=1704499 RepID=A0A1Z4BYA0_9GAMM|nr:hypothetical protein [Methylovulum psychrotolerans]ASF46230.1 hypothetical protein CEK71_09115 [Methylovulum psychrotolerans]